MARFEIVRTHADQPWHVRYRDDNNEIVWSTENYLNRTSAKNAIDTLPLVDGVDVVDVDETGDDAGPKDA